MASQGGLNVESQAEGEKLAQDDGLTKGSGYKVRVSLNVEVFRMVAYLSFWLMVILAVILTLTSVNIDIANSDLIALLGYNNICVYWDYEPARSITALVYPIIEVALLSYFCSHAFRCALAYRRGKLTRFHRNFQWTLCLLTCVFGLWFRMIFVEDVTVAPRQHTAGFLALQVALILLETQNFFYLQATDEWPHAKNWFAWVWYVLYMGVCIFKLILGSGIVNGTPVLDIHLTGPVRIAVVFDILWLVMNAVMPFFFSYYWMKHSKNYELQFSLDNTVAGASRCGQGLFFVLVGVIILAAVAAVYSGTFAPPPGRGHPTPAPEVVLPRHLQSVFPNINLPSDSVFSTEATMNKTMNGELSPNPALVFVRSVAPVMFAQVNTSQPKDKALTRLNALWIDAIVSNTSKAQLATDFPGYQFFGPPSLTLITTPPTQTQADFEAALAILLRSNCFYVSALSRCDTVPCLQTKGTGLFATLIAPMALDLYPRVDSWFDTKFNMTRWVMYNPDGSVKNNVTKFDALMWTVFLLNYHAECLHATLHGLHYFLALALVHSAYESNQMFNFAMAYTWNNRRAWDAVVNLDLGTDKAVLTGGTIKANRGQVLDNLQRTLGRLISYNSAVDFIHKFLFVGVGTQMAADLHLLEDFRAQAELVHLYSHDLVRIFAASKDYDLDKVEQRLAHYCQGSGMIDGHPIFDIKGVDGWLQIQAVSALMHAHTLSFTRFMAVTPSFKSYSTSPNFTAWDMDYWRSTAPTIISRIPGYGLYEPGPFTKATMTDANVTNLLRRFLNLSTALKSEAFERAKARPNNNITVTGWLDSDMWMDDFDGRQITWLTYF